MVEKFHVDIMAGSHSLSLQFVLRTIRSLEVFRFAAKYCSYPFILIGVDHRRQKEHTQKIESRPMEVGGNQAQSRKIKGLWIKGLEQKAV